MIKRLTRYGNDVAIVLDQPVLELLNISFDTRLKITTDGTQIIIAPVSSSESREIDPQSDFSKGQDRNSGQAANQWGRAMAKAVAKVLGGKPLSSRTNEMEYEGGVWVVKSAHYKTIYIGVPVTMLDRVAGIIAVLEEHNGDFSLYKIAPDWFKAHMRPSPAHEGRVMMATCSEIRSEFQAFKRISPEQV